MHINPPAAFFHTIEINLMCRFKQGLQRVYGEYKSV